MPAGGLRRIFVVYTADLSVPAFVEDQAADGIEVRRIRSSAVDSRQKRNLAIFDGKLAWTGVTNTEGEQHANILEAAPDAVRELEREFEDLWERSSPYPDVAQ